MLNAIGSSPTYSPATAGAQTAVLKTQLAQYELKLADCVHCVSANTREGKEKIKELSDKISVVKANIETIEVAKPKAVSAADNEKTSATLSANNHTTHSRPVNGAVGNNLDVYS